MALAGINLKVESNAGGVKSWRYDTTDTLTTVEAASYFARESASSFNDIHVNLTVGDQITVYVWTTTIISGTFIEKKSYTVSAVSTAGVATIVQSSTHTRYSPGNVVTQITTRSTGVAVEGLAGTITGDNTSLAAAGVATFVVTNTFVEIGDVVVISVVSGPDEPATTMTVSAIAAGSFSITMVNQHAADADTGAPIINFAVIKTSSA